MPTLATGVTAGASPGRLLRAVEPGASARREAERLDPWPRPLSLACTAPTP